MQRSGQTRPVDESKRALDGCIQAFCASRLLNRKYEADNKRAEMEGKCAVLAENSSVMLVKDLESCEDSGTGLSEGFRWDPEPCSMDLNSHRSSTHPCSSIAMQDFNVIPLLLHLHTLPHSHHVHPARGGRRCVAALHPLPSNFENSWLIQSRLVNSNSISRLTLAVPLLCSAGSNYLQVLFWKYQLLRRGDS